MSYNFQNKNHTYSRHWNAECIQAKLLHKQQR